MNSFSYKLKDEVAQIIPTGDESISELSAIIKSCGEIIKNKNQQKIVLYTELESVANLLTDIIKNFYGTQVEILQQNVSFLKTERFEITIPSSITQQVLLDTEVLQYDEDKYLNFVHGISKYQIDEEAKELAFLRGVFLGAFSCNISTNKSKTDSTSVVKSHSGYHAEFVFSNEAFAQDFCFLLADFDIISKMTKRKNRFVVYVKGIDMISDLFALVGASKGVISLQNESVLRSIRNSINRQNNCINANLSKTVDASVKQMQAIDKIKSTIGFETLDESLRETVYLRIANPEESLDELVKLSNSKITKSGLYHRFKKLEEIAKNL